MHTDGRCTFEFITISVAISKSAYLSTYTWQFPAAVSTTGTVAFSTTLFIRPFPPRGINISMYPFILISSVAVSLDVSSTMFNAPSGIPQEYAASCIILIIALLEFIASLPPLKIHAFDVLRHKTAASTVTFGLASYIIPITPIGTRFFPIIRPFGRFVIFIISPIGSFNAITSRTPSEIAFILSFVSIRRSIIASRMPLLRAFSISALLASIITSA